MSMHWYPSSPPIYHLWTSSAIYLSQTLSSRTSFLEGPRVKAKVVAATTAHLNLTLAVLICESVVQQKKFAPVSNYSCKVQLFVDRSASSSRTSFLMEWRCRDETQLASPNASWGLEQRSRQSEPSSSASWLPQLALPVPPICAMNI